MKISNSIERWPFLRPFHIAGHTFDGVDVLVATVTAGGLCGHGEAAGVYYRGETTDSMAAEIDRLAQDVGIESREELRRVMAPGGARNALDCALWDLEAKQARQPVWQLAGLNSVRPLLTTLTIGGDTPGRMAGCATLMKQARALKLKLLGDGGDAERVRAVRAVRPDVWLGVDANQGFTPASFHALLPTLVEAKVQLVEQPFPIERDADLDGLGSPIALAVDESVLDQRDIERFVGRADVINIKLDKCGGLTEALEMVSLAHSLGFKAMVGTMPVTSLSTAVGFVLGQLCDFVDLDGPIFLARDREPSVAYVDGHLHCPDAVWGSATSSALAT
jgi:L-alanine-DL-glutamate epimerase-like enolase superfamily enzyme